MCYVRFFHGDRQGERTVPFDGNTVGAVKREVATYVRVQLSDVQLFPCTSCGLSVDPANDNAARVDSSDHFLALYSARAAAQEAKEEPSWARSLQLHNEDALRQQVAAAAAVPAAAEPPCHAPGLLDAEVHTDVDGGYAVVVSPLASTPAGART